jgi:hypothetical protein
LGRVGDHIVDHQRLPAAGGQAVQRRLQRAAAVQKVVGDEHRARAGMALAQQGAQAASQARFDKNVGDGLK